MLTSYDNIGAMFWLYLQYLCLQMPEIAQIFTEESCMLNKEYTFMLNCWGLYQSHVWAISGACSGDLYHIKYERVQIFSQFLSGPTGNYFMISNDQDHSRTIVGPYSSHIGAKLSSNVRAIFRPFHVIVDNFHYIGCSSEAASGNMVKFSKVHASRISRSEKISRYNRKRVSRAHHTKCMHHIGCSSEAVSGNVVKLHIGGDFTKKILTASTRRFQKYIYNGVL